MLDIETYVNQAKEAIKPCITQEMKLRALELWIIKFRQTDYSPSKKSFVISVVSNRCEKLIFPPKTS